MVLIALLLIIEGLSTGLWIAKVVPVIGSFSAVAVGLVVLRGLVGATQLVSGVFLMGGRRSAVGLARAALLASALLTTFEIGKQLTPNNLVPTWRWPLVTAYWVYAVGAAAYVGYEDKRWPGREERAYPEVQKRRAVDGQERTTPEVQERTALEVQESNAPEVQERKTLEVGEPDAHTAAPPTEDPTESGERPRFE